MRRNGRSVLKAEGDTVTVRVEHQASLGKALLIQVPLGASYLTETRGLDPLLLMDPIITFRLSSTPNRAKHQHPDLSVADHALGPPEVRSVLNKSVFF